MWEYSGTSLAYKPLPPLPQYQPYIADGASFTPGYNNMVLSGHRQAEPISGSAMSQHQDQPQYTPSDAWPSPPLEPGDLGINYAFGPATSAAPDLNCDAKYTQDAPGLFMSDKPSAQHDGQISPQALQLADMCTPTSLIDQSAESQSPNMMYSQLNTRISFDAACSSVPANIQAVRPDLTLRSNGPELSPRSQPSPRDSPDSAHIPRAFTTPPLPQPGRLPERGSEAGPLSRGAHSPNGDKSDEPYAKLIYRAFMSRPNYSMTLQEIYQWFRDNSSKALTEHGGWQNSIRHNLSMNAAFRKRDRPVDKEGKDASESSAKRVNEWYLEDWAIKDGVQSTTRYRKTHYTRGRPGTLRDNHPWIAEHSHKRAVSGRKGGCATRAARQRRHGMNQGLQYVSVPTPVVGGHSSPCQSSRLGRYQHGERSPAHSYHPPDGMSPLGPYANNGLPTGEDDLPFQPYQIGMMDMTMGTVASGTATAATTAPAGTMMGGGSVLDSRQMIQPAEYLFPSPSASASANATGRPVMSLPSGYQDTRRYFEQQMPHGLGGDVLSSHMFQGGHVERQRLWRPSDL